MTSPVGELAWPHERGLAGSCSNPMFIASKILFERDAEGLEALRGREAVAIEVLEPILGYRGVGEARIGLGEAYIIM